MDIRYTTGKPRETILMASEKRGVQVTLRLLKEIKEHLEGDADPDDDGTATAILSAGFEAFANKYAPPAPEPPDKSKGAKKGDNDGT